MDAARTVYQIDATSPGSEAAADAAAALASASIPFHKVDRNYSSLLLKNSKTTEVSTVICGRKELKKIVGIKGQLDTVKRIIYMHDEGFPDEVSLMERVTGWTLASFSEVERLGRKNPVDADLPVSADIAVIMYTSGSTGLPKVPALQRFMRHRMQLQQQGGVHITSSTILTSTLHIARLNTRNPSPPNDLAAPHAGDMHTVTTAGSEVAQPVDGSSAENQDVGGPLLQSLGSSNQVESVQNTNSLNSFASLLLWVLGGGSSDGLVSFLSMFRDMREQGQTFAQTPRGQGDNQPPQNPWWRRF